MLKVWTAALLWLGLIATESSTLGSSSNTSRILYPVLHYLFGVDLVHFEVWHTVIRKSGHVLGYFMLSLLLFRAWRKTLPRRGSPVWSLHWARVAWLMTTVVASLDEWHQAYIPTRGSSVHDVALDSAAALAAQIVIWLWLRRKTQRDEFERSPASA
jgi:VanZ family protein